MAFTDELKTRIRDFLKDSVEPRLYDAWLKNGLSFVEEREGELKIPLPNQFYVDWYKKTFLSHIQRAVHEISGKEYSIVFSAPPEQKSLFPEPLVSTGKSKHRATQPITNPTPESRETPKREGRPGNKYDFVLNNDYVFEKFVVGASNRLAHAAAMAVAENPGKAYNPIFIHGGVGLGKTHLLQAVTHRIISKFPNASIYFRSGEGFVNDYITAVKNNAFEKFRNSCRSRDVLIIDDIHFLGSGEKEASQEEFFHTFNALHNAHKQILLSSDSPPKDIPKIQERLVSRFNWGMVARLETPDFETRVAILRQKTEHYKTEIPGDVINFIAQAIESNIRDLEGALIRLFGLARSSNQSPSVALASEALKDIVATLPSHQVKIGAIMEIIASYFNLSASDLQSKSRTKNVSLARQIGFYITRQLKPDLSLEDIGAAFGGREHSTVLHAIEKIRKRFYNDAQFKDTLNLLIAETRKKSV